MGESVFVGALLGAGIAMLFIRLSGIERRLNRLSHLDPKADTLLRASGVAFYELADVPSDVRDALQRGETILAIKRFARRQVWASKKRRTSWMRSGGAELRRAETGLAATVTSPPTARLTTSPEYCE